MSGERGWLGRYLDHLTAERGLARNSVEAYRRDLGLLASRLPEGRSLEEARRDDLLSVLRRLRAEGRSPRSIARFLVAVRGWFAFLLGAGVIAEDPSARLEAPRLWTQGQAVEIEEGYGAAAPALKARGHDVAILPHVGGGMNAIASMAFGWWTRLKA